MNDAIAQGGRTGFETAYLKRQLKRVEREKKLVAFGLMLPALLYMVANFVVPVGVILFKSVDDRGVSTVLHRTSAAIADWAGGELPNESVYAALAADLKESEPARTTHIAAKRLNSAKTGYQALLKQTARRVSKMDAIAPGAAKETLLGIDKRWADSAYWATIKRTANPVTPVYLLSAVDLTLNEGGDIVRSPEYMRVYNKVWVRTFWMSTIITLLCLAMGYPVAYEMAHARPRVANVMIVLVLVPFWTSLLVRTTAWVVLLQNEGVLNDFGLWAGWWAERVQLIHNRFGVYVAMSHILLPFMVLPLYAIMRRIPPDYMRAAKSLGANPLAAFLKVYVPLTRHGVGAGALFVFILAAGFYVTPELVGGSRDQMISYFIAFYADETLNWGAAAALSALLLLLTAAMFFLMNVLFGINKMKMQ